MNCTHLLENGSAFFSGLDSIIKWRPAFFFYNFFFSLYTIGGLWGVALNVKDLVHCYDLTKKHHKVWTIQLESSEAHALDFCWLNYRGFRPLHWIVWVWWVFDVVITWPEGVTFRNSLGASWLAGWISYNDISWQTGSMWNKLLRMAFGDAKSVYSEK